MKYGRIAIAAVLLAVCALTARADTWGPWEPMGNSGISIRFAQVNREMCTWAFRNDTNRVLAGLNFSIDNIDANTGAQDHNTDLLPYSLGPGHSVGGWAAFSATANCRTVRITATNIQWR